MRTSLRLSFAATAALLAAGAAYAQQPEAPAKPRAEQRGPATRADAEQRSARTFARMDANGDGVLDAADREAARRQAFDSVDTDRDGSISFAEFDARRGDRQAARAERGTRDARGFGRRGGPGMARIADADGDGSVTQVEFTTAALARFDRADADKDGTISLEERRDARHHSRHDRRRGPPARDAG